MSPEDNESHSSSFREFTTNDRLFKSASQKELFFFDRTSDTKNYVIPLYLFLNRRQTL